MSRLILVAVMWAAALLPLSTLAQVRGGTFRGPVVGPRVSPGFRGPAVGPRVGPGFRGPVVGPGVRPGFRPAGPSPFFGARPVAPSAGRVFVNRPLAPQGRIFINRPLAPPGRVHGSHSHVIFTTNPFAFNNCGGVLPCNPFFFSGHFFGSPFFPGSFFPGSFWPYSYGYIPGFSSDLYYPQQQQQQPVVMTSDNSNDVQFAVQMQRLTDEVEQLRDEQARQASEARQPPPPGTSMSALPPAALTTFVFRDGHRLTAQNYAIAGQTLWIFSEHTAKRISLADIDLAATQQVNASNGVDIHLPELHTR